MKSGFHDGNIGGEGRGEKGKGRSKENLTYPLTLDSHKQYHINSKQDKI